ALDVARTPGAVVRAELRPGGTGSEIASFAARPRLSGHALALRLVARRRAARARTVLLARRGLFTGGARCGSFPGGARSDFPARARFDSSAARVRGVSSFVRFEARAGFSAVRTHGVPGSGISASRRPGVRPDGAPRAHERLIVRVLHGARGEGEPARQQPSTQRSNLALVRSSPADGDRGFPPPAPARDSQRLTVA